MAGVGRPGKVRRSPPRHESSPDLRCLDGTWSELSKPEDGPVGNWAHSPDFKYFYYTTRGQDPRIIRVRMADMKSEVVSCLKNLDVLLGR